MFSQDFLKRLTPREKRTLVFREVEDPAGLNQRRFFELAGNSRLPLVSFEGSTGLSLINWICPKCSNRNLYPKHPRMLDIQRFISRSDLPDPLPSCFVIGCESEGYTLCMTVMRWKQFAGKPGTRGIATMRVGVVDDAVLVRSPRLPAPPEF